MSNIANNLETTREMKDSGIEWIGEIPKEWGVVFINQIFTQHKSKNTELKENNLLSLSYGRIIRKNIETKEGLLPENFNSYNTFCLSFVSTLNLSKSFISVFNVS